MKHFLFILLFASISNAQIVTIPDANFKAKLLAADSSNTTAKDVTGNYFKIDANDDGEIQESEALQVSYLDVSASTIASLIGINSFTSLTNLSCPNNQITSLDFSSLGNLISLNCSNNQLTSLDLSYLSILNVLDCSSNQLTSLNVNNLVNLTHFACSNNLITSLDVSSLGDLTNLVCSQNQLTSLDISNLGNLIVLGCSQNQLTSLDVSNLANLTYLYCSNNQLTSIAVTNLVNLIDLNCSNNQITSIAVNNLVNLIDLNCSQNQLTSLDISNLVNLVILNCGSNQLTALDVNNLVNLTQFFCFQNQLTSLNVSNLVSLTQLICYENQITSLDVSNLGILNFLYCSNNSITSLNVSNIVNLSSLVCDGNLLTTLSISNLVNLNTFDYSNNQIPYLDVSNLVNLTSFGCEGNGITSLNVTNLVNLTQLYCSNNLLTSLDVNNLSLLNQLGCSNNQLNFLLIKNNNSIWNTLEFQNNPSLLFICADDEDINLVQNKIDQNGYTNCHVSSYCSFTPGGNFNTIKGAVTFDANTNGCDALDVLQPNIRMNINDGTNQGATYSNNAGNYTFYTQTGSFDLLPSLENPTWFTLSPTTATIPFANNNNNESTQNFCITPNGIHNDLEIVIAPVTPARPGFDASYLLVYKNKGNQTLSGAIDFTYNDAVLDFITSTITPDNQTTGTLSWNYTNLLPFENRSILITLNVNSPVETPAVSIDDILSFSATINPVSGDETTTDNVFDYNQTVVGAYDPNSVECLEGETLDPALIGNYLHYVINFENLGNYQAENVVVKDIIDANKYDLNSLQILNTSHNSYTRLTGNILEFIFEDINLAPAAGNPPVGGHGTILFKIKPKENLVVNDFVNKNANIYFDYNAPIETNLETTTFAVLSNSIFVVDESVAVSPNPTSSILQIHSKNTIQSIAIYDVQGRLLEVKTTNSKETTLDISTNTNGVYFLKINTEFGSKAIKIVKN